MYGAARHNLIFLGLTAGKVSGSWDIFNEKILLRVFNTMHSMFWVKQRNPQLIFRTMLEVHPQIYFMYKGLKFVQTTYL